MKTNEPAATAASVTNNTHAESARDTLSKAIRSSVLKGAQLDSDNVSTFEATRNLAKEHATGDAFKDVFNTAYKAAIEGVKKSHPAIAKPHQASGMSTIRAYRATFAAAIDLHVDLSLSWADLREAVKVAKASTPEALAAASEAEQQAQLEAEAAKQEAAATIERQAAFNGMTLDEAIESLVEAHGLGAVINAVTAKAGALADEESAPAAATA